MYNKIKQTLYDLLMAILSLIVVIMLIIDNSCNLSDNIKTVFEITDYIILIIFAVDYFIRLYLAKDKKLFIKTNIIDLITIIPFNSIFQAAKILRITKLFKFAKLIKALKIFKSVVILLKFRKHIDSFLKTNNFQYVLWITLSTLFIGTIGIHLTEGISYGNALWWSFVTITTVGYGDISPATPIGRILASLLMLVGIGFLSMLTGTISTFFLNKNNSKNHTSYKNDVIENIKSRLDNFDELSSEDIENIYRTLKALKC